MSRGDFLIDFLISRPRFFCGTLNAEVSIVNEHAKRISILLSPEERAALYEASRRECRRPDDQARYLILRGLGLRSQNENVAARAVPLLESSSVLSK